MCSPYFNPQNSFKTSGWEMVHLCHRSAWLVESSADACFGNEHICTQLQPFLSYTKVLDFCPNTCAVCGTLTTPPPTTSTTSTTSTTTTTTEGPYLCGEAPASLAELQARPEGADTAFNNTLLCLATNCMDGGSLLKFVFSANVNGSADFCETLIPLPYHPDTRDNDCNSTLASLNYDSCPNCGTLDRNGDRYISNLCPYSCGNGTQSCPRPAPPTTSTTTTTTTTTIFPLGNDFTPVPPSDDFIQAWCPGNQCLTSYYWPEIVVGTPATTDQVRQKRFRDSRTATIGRVFLKMTFIVLQDYRMNATGQADVCPSSSFCVLVKK